MQEVFAVNRQEFEDTARRYREEMFRMYAAQSIEPKPKPEPHRAVPAQSTPAQNMQEPAPLQTQEPVQQTPQQQIPQTAVSRPQDSASADSDAPLRVPERENALLAPFVPEQQDSTEPEMSKRAYTGIIRIHVFTAQGAMPVAGAAVTVTRTENGQTDLISLQTTDQSGCVPPLTVPAPPPSEDQRAPAYFVYDIAVQAAGYYREQSTDVPVFPNVTSVQSFDLIPLPAGGDETGGSITYYNNMQQY